MGTFCSFYECVSGGLPFNPLIKNALMAIVLLLGAIFPQYINIFGVTLGLFLLKTAVIINAVKNRKESKG